MMMLTRWTLRLKTHDGKGLNAFGAYGNPARQKRFEQRRHIKAHAAAGCRRDAGACVCVGGCVYYCDDDYAEVEIEIAVACEISGLIDMLGDSCDKHACDEVSWRSSAERVRNIAEEILLETLMIMCNHVPYLPPCHIRRHCAFHARRLAQVRCHDISSGVQCYCRLCMSIDPFTVLGKHSHKCNAYNRSAPNSTHPAITLPPPLRQPGGLGTTCHHYRILYGGKQPQQDSLKLYKIPSALGSCMLLRHWPHVVHIHTTKHQVHNDKLTQLASGSAI